MSGTAPDVKTSMEALLARAEELLAASAQVESPFRRDADYDEITALVARGCGPTLWRFCVKQHGVDATHAEDLVQQTLLAFRLALPAFERRSALKTFVYAIASNVVRADRARAGRREQILAADVATVATLLHGDGRDDAAEAAVERERLVALERALGGLPDREAFLVRARLGDKLDYEQILPRFQARFGDRVTTVEGLRTLFFHTKRRLIASLAQDR